MKQRLASIVTSFWRNKNGSIAAMEFAVLLPLFLILIIGGVEFNRYITAKQKHAQALITIADYIGQQEEACQPEMITLTQNIVYDPLRKYAAAGNDFLTITGYEGGCGAVPCRLWQMWRGYNSGRGFAMPNFESTGLPGGLTMDADDHYVAIQSFFTYKPLLDITPNFIGLFNSNNPTYIYNDYIIRPRNDNLKILLGGRC